MRIDSIYLRDVGPFDEVTIDFPVGRDPGLADVYLLTGPNGCGKSTVLYAIAALLGGEAEGLLRRRMRSAKARVSAHVGDGVLIATPSSISLETPQPISIRRQPIEWAAFAYAGTRHVSDGRVTAISEPKTDPFDKVLAFHDTADTSVLAHWIASQYLKELKADKNGQSARAAEIRQSISEIESTISGITGDAFEFDLSGDDNDVRVRRNGIVVEMGVLPDGLKSIVSWVADLLMRLERIPWVGNAPPMQRPFLLLLDEIDIHLHPEWQRRVLPVVQKLFPNAQIIASTHSPFVVASAADAYVIPFVLENGKSTLGEVRELERGVSYGATLRDVFGVASEFDTETESMLADFHRVKDRLLQGLDADRAAVDALALTIAKRSEELASIMGFEVRQLDRHLKKLATG